MSRTGDAARRPSRSERRPATAGATLGPRLRLVLGDQLDPNGPQVAAYDAGRDRIVLIEAPGEATHVWSHKARVALFLSAMRHYAAERTSAGFAVIHVALDDPAYVDAPGLVDRLARLLADHAGAELVIVEPGEWRLARDIEALCGRRRIALTVLPDEHFLCTRAEFTRWAGNRRELRMEHFYRTMRRRHAVLVDDQGEPEGGRWNFDADNRSAFPRRGPGEIAAPARFAPDVITREVLALVERVFPGHPGDLRDFGWPVTRAQALAALDRFIGQRLPQFGRYQDAMWTDTPFGWHALLSSSLNLKLIRPREVIAAAERAYRERALPLAAVEGFVRQVLGWREFVRGVYWHFMPQLAEANFFGHARRLPRWYWTGETRMNCMRAVIGQTLQHGYAHHIQRLMVTGQFALLAEIEPRQVADWYLAVYVDAVEWAELPNTAGMALYADGGRFTSKPYVASGAYIKRQSNYCTGCAYRPDVRTGERACPVSTLFWNFVIRHERWLAASPRTVLMAKNGARLDANERAAIGARAAEMLDNADSL
jgi:deoxyribodipyrimidine photolyase-related protein